MDEESWSDPIEVEDEPKITEEEIGELADNIFPIKDGSGTPMYREHQRETIIEICKAFMMDDIDYIGVEGPVGCGKSVINYTVARIIGSTIYLTPLKMLQDQIISENWDGVRMIKGRNAYACNYCGYENNYFRCDYDGDEYKTCQNSKVKNNYSASTLNSIKQRLELLFRENNPFNIKLRTSFESLVDFLVLIPKMRKFLDSNGESGTSFSAERAIACAMDAVHECPVKSSRLLAKMAPIKVLNPDIFFLITTNYNEHYSDSELMVYDESHQIEGVINRIFKIKIPIDTIKEMFGLDMTPLCDLNEFEGLLAHILNYVNKVLGPATAAAKTISSMGDMLNVKNSPTMLRMKSENDLAMKFKECASGFLRRKWNSDRTWTLSMMELANYAFTGKDLPEELKELRPFIDLLKEYFASACMKYECNMKFNVYDEIAPTFYRIFDTNYINRARKHKTKDLEKDEKNDNIDFGEIMVSPDRILADHMVFMKQIIEPFVTSIHNLSTIGKEKKPSFTISRSNEETRKVCSGTPLHKEVMANPKYDGRIEKCLEIVPIAIGKLMNAFFYSKTKKVLLTSGTWVGPDSLFKLYGFPKEKSRFIQIPSTFKPESRPIYVIDNRGFTNFSEKADGPWLSYMYKTPEGVKKFTLEMSSIVKRMRRYIRDNHGENANIVVHCHTFDIAKKIAEFAPGVDDTYLIHLPQAGSHIQNILTNHVVWAKSKDELIQTIKSNPNSGLTIISPSISEGVDFKDKIARAQIILKRPIPYLGDVYVQSYHKGNPDVGIERDPDYLDRICYTTMTQQYGRMMRSKDDWGITVIMDQSITMALKSLLRGPSRKIRGLNIGYFAEGLQFEYNRNRPVFKWPFG
jgi:Rad3-related DNA helicase